MKRSLWNFPIDQLSRMRYFLVKMLRVFALASKRFVLNRDVLKAASLTYYSLMAIVPILALSFGIAKGLGMQELLEKGLFERFSDQSEILDKAIPLATKVLEETKGGLIALIGFFVLLWSVLKVIGHLKSAINTMWGTTRMGNWKRALSDYLVMLLFVPFFFIFSGGLKIFLSQRVVPLFSFLPFGELLSSSVLVVPWIFVLGIFIFFYMFLPRTKVFFSSALVGGIVGCVLYWIMQYSYVHFQMGVSRYGAIYGSFAALPLFLVWLQLTWLIILYGSEICFSWQNVKGFEYYSVCKDMSYLAKQEITLLIVYIGFLHLKNKHEPITLDLLYKKYRIPVFLSTKLMDKMLECGIFTEVKLQKKAQVGFLINADTKKTRIFDVIEELEGYGITHLPFLKNKMHKNIANALESFRGRMQKAKENIRLKDL